MTLFSEAMLSQKIVHLLALTEFLHRFINAANSHVELASFIEEGEELLRSIER